MRGLGEKEAAARIRQDGWNRLAEPEKPHPVRILVRQFTDIMVMILLIAAGISWGLGAVADAITIGVIVLLNGLLGFIQEYRTEQTLQALRGMAAPTAKVWRDGKLVTRQAEALVVGDIIEVEAGDCVPADGVIVEATRLWAEESLLTGESCSVEKCTCREDISETVSGRCDMLYAGTSVTRGHGIARVIATGKRTQMGQISQLLTEIKTEPTPLQKRLGELGRTVAIICLGVCIIVAGAGILRGEPVFGMLMTGITIAIAAIPEGLPATVTIALALAVRQMLKRQALVNRLHAVETLGCASVICTDKTGTITENRMTVQRLYAGDIQYAMTGTGWSRSGQLHAEGIAASPHGNLALQSLLRCAVLCNHATITPSGEEYIPTGDPTEAALLIAAAKCGVVAEGCTRWQVVGEIPFESETRSMTVYCRHEGGIRAYRKGALDVILPACRYYRAAGGIQPMTPEKRAALTCMAESWGSEALRVLAFAEEDVKAPMAATGEMVFLGFMGMIDPPRAQARKAIARCIRAGIRVVMLTGDDAKTAAAIAQQAGIPNSGRAITGVELDKMDDKELAQALKKCGVYARVTPAHKLRLVRAFRRQGEICAMTGDGVNDAPAVKEADIGVAMGKNGTDVTRQAADVVLLDDRFDTLAAAVEQGRTVYANIRKFVRYLLACNIGEVLTMFLGILMGMPVVLLPTQILLVNLLTDGLPAVALGLEPPTGDIMERPPRRGEESFFAGGLLSRIIFRGIFIALSTLGSFTTVYRLTGEVSAARTGALLTLITSQLIHVFECKQEAGTLLTVRYGTNGKLVLAVICSMVVTGAAILWAPMREIFGTVQLTGAPLLAAFGMAAIVPIVATLPEVRGER